MVLGRGTSLEGIPNNIAMISTWHETNIYSLEPKGTPARPHHQENKALLRLRDHAGYLRMPCLLGAAIWRDVHDLLNLLYHLFQSQTARGWDKQLLLCKAPCPFLWTQKQQLLVDLRNEIHVKGWEPKSINSYQLTFYEFKETMTKNKKTTASPLKRCQNAIFHLTASLWLLPWNWDQCPKWALPGMYTL